MMKKHAIVLAALIGAASAQAQVYGTVAGGATHLGMDCTGATSCDTSGTGVKLVGGYAFGNGFSLEAGYIATRQADAKSVKFKRMPRDRRTQGKSGGPE